MIDLHPNVANPKLVESYLEIAVASDRLSYRKDLSAILEFYERRDYLAIALGDRAMNRLEKRANKLQNRSNELAKAKPLLAFGAQTCAKDTA